MFSSMFISSREILEAALIVGIILGQLVQNKRKDLIKYVYFGIATGAVTCLIMGTFLFILLSGNTTGNVNPTESYVLLLSAAFIAYLPFWLHRNAGAQQIQNKVAQNTGKLGLFLLAFLSVFREGSELVIFILAKVQSNAYDVATGILLGIILGVLVAVLIFKTSVKLNLSYLFTGLSIILTFLGGEMFQQGLSMAFGLGNEVTYTCAILFIVGALLLLFQKNFRAFFNKSET